MNRSCRLRQSGPLVGLLLIATGCSRPPAEAPIPPPPPPPPVAAAPAPAPVAAAPAPVTPSPAPVATPPAEPAPSPTALGGAALGAYQAGVGAFKSGDLKGAQQQFGAAASQSGGSPTALIALGATLERQGDVRGAEDAYERAVKAAPAGSRERSQAIEATTLFKLRQGQATQAERWLSGLRSQGPDQADLVAATAEVKSVQGDSAAAQKLAGQALKLDPAYVPAMLVIARDHLRQRRQDLALLALQAILDGINSENPAREPGNPDALLLRARIYAQRGAHKAALAEYERVVAVRPDSVEAQLALGVAALQAGNATQAARALTQVLRYEPANLTARVNLGDALRLLARPADAERELVWVRSQKPDMPEVHYNLGLLYLFSEQVAGKTPLQALDASIKEFERYRELRPRSPGDGAEELIARAKNKRAVLEAQTAEAAPPAGGTP